MDIAHWEFVGLLFGLAVACGHGFPMFQMILEPPNRLAEDPSDTGCESFLILLPARERNWKNRERNWK
jgi:hypothetical protein